MAVAVTFEALSQSTVTDAGVQRSLLCGLAAAMGVDVGGVNLISTTDLATGTTVAYDSDGAYVVTDCTAAMATSGSRRLAAAQSSSPSGLRLNFTLVQVASISAQSLMSVVAAQAALLSETFADSIVASGFYDAVARVDPTADLGSLAPSSLSLQVVPSAPAAPAATAQEGKSSLRTVIIVSAAAAGGGAVALIVAAASVYTLRTRRFNNSHSEEEEAEPVSEAEAAVKAAYQPGGPLQDQRGIRMGGVTSAGHDRRRSSVSSVSASSFSASLRDILPLGHQHSHKQAQQEWTQGAVSPRRRDISSLSCDLGDASAIDRTDVSNNTKPLSACGGDADEESSVRHSIGIGSGGNSNGSPCHGGFRASNDRAVSSEAVKVEMVVNQ